LGGWTTNFLPELGTTSKVVGASTEAVDEVAVASAAEVAVKELGMDSDVWKSELSAFVSTKNVNMDIRIHIHF
jgi:hypothetical protein